MLRPERQNLTPRTQAFFRMVFPDSRLDHPITRELHEAWQAASATLSLNSPGTLARS